MGATRGTGIFGLLMTRNDADILRANILLHLAIGCERILVVDNGSDDATPKILAAMARRHPVDWSRDEGDLRQSEIVTAMARDAHEMGAEWVIPLDTDEFWHPSRPLPEICAAAHGVGALEVPRIEFIQAREQIHSTRRAPLKAVMRVDPVLTGIEAVEEFAAKQRSMFELAPPPKLLMRTSAEIEVARGAHTAQGLRGPVESTPDLAIFHLAMRSRDVALLRIEHGKRIERVESDPSVGFQSRYWLAMADEDRLDEAWRAHSYEDGALDVGGRRVELLPDGRLAEVLAPWVSGPLRRLWMRAASRLTRR